MHSNWKELNLINILGNSKLDDRLLKVNCTVKWSIK